MAKKKSAKTTDQDELDSLIQDDEPLDLDAVIADLEKKFGDSIQWGNAIVATKATPTGLASLDICLGCFGIPEGRIVEIYGTESSGKTTLALQIAASFQQHNKLVAYIDAEHALDYDWATHIGVDVKKVLLSQPDSGEQALDIIQAIVASKIASLVIVDSVAALVPQEELDGDIGDRQIGAQARLMSKGMRKLAGFCLRSGTTVIFINQLRDKIGQTFGHGPPPETTPGGRALKFYASIRMEVRRAETLRADNRPYGIATKVKIAKNKVAPPFRSTSLEIHFGSKAFGASAIWGFNKVQALIDGAVESTALKLRGSNYYFGDRRVAAGKEKVVTALVEDMDLYQQISDETYRLMRESSTSTVPVVAEAKDTTEPVELEEDN
jgi:recombination protein RecA